MSIGFAVTLPDGALLVADGRQIRPQRDGDVIADDVDKIERVSNLVFAIPFGVVQGTAPALERLRTSLSGVTSPESFIDLLHVVLLTSWNELLGRVTSDVDINHPTMRIGFVAGGLSEGTGFVAAALHGTGVNQEPLLRQGAPWQVTSLGGEEMGAQNLFIADCEAALRTVAWEADAVPVNSAVRAVLGAALRTIECVADVDRTIGGIVRFVVIRRNYPVFKDVLQNVP